MSHVRRRSLLTLNRRILNAINLTLIDSVSAWQRHLLELGKSAILFWGTRLHLRFKIRFIGIMGGDTIHTSYTLLLSVSRMFHNVHNSITQEKITMKTCCNKLILGIVCESSSTYIISMTDCIIGSSRQAFRSIQC